MTPKEFKQKYPEFYHLEGKELWNKMEDMLLEQENSWTADYSEGRVELDTRTLSDGTSVTWNDPAHWVNDKTGERLTSQEYRKRHKFDVFERVEQPERSLESFSFGFLDLKTGEYTETPKFYSEDEDE